MLDDRFLWEFKRQTEAYWQTVAIKPGIYGLQFQRGTRWNAGLNDAEIEAFESTLVVHFPEDYKRMLRVMNGTDLSSINTYGLSGDPHGESAGVYSYPRDLAVVRELREGLRRDRDGIAAVLLEQHFLLEDGAELVPISGHRYLVCGSDSNQSVVLSIVGMDAIVYGDSLRACLELEFIRP